MPLSSFLLVLSVCLIWALNVIISKIAVDQLAIAPIFYTVVRSAVVVALLAPWLWPLPRPFLRTLLVAVSIGGGSFALLFIGLRTSSPSAAAVVSLLSAPAAVLLSIIILREWIGWLGWLGLALTLSGVLIVVADPNGLEIGAGLGFVAASAVLGAFGAVVLKTVRAGALQLQAWSGATGVFFLFPITAALEERQLASAIDAGWRFVAIVAFSSIVVSIIAHTTYFRMLQRHDVNVVAPLTLLTPIFTIGLGALITADPIGLSLVVGALIALTGVLVIILRPTRVTPKALLVRSRL